MAEPKRFQSEEKRQGQDRHRRKDESSELCNGYPVYIRCCAQQISQRVNEQISKTGNCDTDNALKHHTGIECSYRIFVIPCCHTPRYNNACSRSNGHAECNKQLYNGDCNTGSGHCRTSQPDSDKHSVYNNINGIEKKPCHLRKGIPDEYSTGRFLIHVCLTSQKSLRDLVDLPGFCPSVLSRYFDPLHLGPDQHNCGTL